MGTAIITKDVPLNFTVPLNSRVKIADYCPLYGIIKTVTIQWPRNCNGLVHVAFGHSDIWVTPAEANTFLALDDITWVSPNMNEPVIKNEMLWAEIRNGDGANPHTITVIATIVGREDKL